MTIKPGGTLGGPGSTKRGVAPRGVLARVLCGAAALAAAAVAGCGVVPTRLGGRGHGSGPSAASASSSAPSSSAPSASSAASSSAIGDRVESRTVGDGTVFRARATDRQRFQVHLDFGRVFAVEGDFERALQEYKDALAVAEAKTSRREFKDADRALAHRRIAVACDRLGRFKQSGPHFQAAIQLEPKNVKNWNDAGYSDYLQGRFKEAEQAFRAGLKHAPDDARARTNLGMVLAASGRSSEALSVLSAPQGDAIGHANLGYLLAASGQYAPAREQYKKALALRPDLELARRALAQIDRQAQASNGLAPAHGGTNPVGPVRTSQAGPVPDHGPGPGPAPAPAGRERDPQIQRTSMTSENASQTGPIVVFDGPADRPSARIDAPTGKDANSATVADVARTIAELPELPAEFRVSKQDAIRPAASPEQATSVRRAEAEEAAAGGPRRHEEESGPVRAANRPRRRLWERIRHRQRHHRDWFNRERDRSAR